MPDKLTDVADNSVGKITDSEIVKALECCNTEYEDYQCPHCPLLHKGCKKALVQNALDLINRLQAEKEELVGNADKLKAELFDKTEQLKTAKTEAYEEFAEWLKEAFSDFDELLERITPENIYKAIDDFFERKGVE